MTESGLQATSPQTGTGGLPPAAVAPSTATTAAPAPTATDPGAPALFRDPSAPVRARAQDLLDRLTADERVTMLHQYAPAVERLGVGAFRTGTEGLHGLAWLGEATVFPQPVGLGATWDPDLLREVGAEVARQVRAKHAADPTVSLTVWAPVVNLLRDPRWGRNEEGYSEDVRLSADLGAAYCRGLAGDDLDRLVTAPVVKHFLAYNHEDARDVTSAGLPPRVLHEYDLPVFTRTLAEGHAVGVMPSYNLVNGRPNHVTPLLQTLREATTDDLFVCSDAEAPSNLAEAEDWAPDHPSGHAATLRAGVDSLTDHGDQSHVTVARLREALERGLLTAEDVDRAVLRQLMVRVRLGEFDPDGGPHATGDRTLDGPTGQQLARRAATAQVVLLRNDLAGGAPASACGGDGPVLPLDPAHVRRAVVLGPFAERLCEDWYSGTMPYTVTVAQGLRDLLRGTDAEVVVHDGADHVLLTLAGRTVAVAADGTLTTVDGAAAGTPLRLDDWGADQLTFADTTTGRFLTAAPEGDVAVPVTATARCPHAWVVHETFRLVPGADGATTLEHVATGRPLGLDDRGRVVLLPAGGTGADASVVVVRPGLDDALATLDGADAVVLVLGNDPLINGRETIDRPGLTLAPSQQSLLEAVLGRRPDAVLVITSSYPYALADAETAARTVVWSSHAGQETGHAVADVLCGLAEPAGRLAQTWYRDERGLPPMLEYDVVGTGRTYLYGDLDPLFPFGHGLGYARTVYTDATCTVDEGARTLTVALTVTNPSAGTAHDVVQVYASVPQRDPGDASGAVLHPHAGPAGYRRRLVGYRRVELAPGASAPLVVTVPWADLAVHDVVDDAPRVPAGPVQVLLARSAEDVEETFDVSLPVPARPTRSLAGPVPVLGYDAHRGTEPVDLTPTAGDAVAVPSSTCPASPAWVRFDLVDTSALAGAVLRVEAAGLGTGPTRVSLHLHGATGPELAVLEVPAGTDRYAYTWYEAPLDLAAAGLADHDLPAVGDLALVVDGTVRLHRVQVAQVAR